jgi:cyclase
VWGSAGTVNTKRDSIEWAVEMERQGAGEIVLTSIDREGTWSGLDADLIRSVSEAVNIPIIAHGGAGTVDHIVEAVAAGASAVALGSMVVFQKKELGILVNFPDRAELAAKLHGS